MSTCFQRKKTVRRIARNRGFLSIEAIIVLIIIIVLLGIGASKSGILSGLADTNAEVNNVTAMAGSMKSIKSTSGYGPAGTDLSAQLIASGFVPTNVAIVGGVLQNSVGGTYVITSTGAGYSFASTGLDKTICVQTAVAMSKNNTFATTQIGSGSAIAGEVTTAAATAACSGSNMTITWISKT